MPYKLDHKYRGTALIIGNEFIGQPAERKGCSEDVRMMKELFKSLDFHVVDCTNLKAAQMKKIIENASKKKENEKCDCFVLVLSTHGTEVRFEDKQLKNPSGADVWRHGVFGEDGEILFVDEIMDYFTDDKKDCTLRGKPKLFFIQACRSRKLSNPSQGDKYDAGYKVNVISMLGNTSGEDGVQRANQGDTKDTEDSLYTIDLSDTDDIYSQWEKDQDAWIPENMTKTSGSNPSQEDAVAEFSEEDAGGSGDSEQMPQSPFDIVPIKCPEDCLIMYPVMSGKGAFRDPGDGSYLFQYLYKQENLAMLLDGCNILQYLTQVSRNMSNFKYEPNLDAISRQDKEQAEQARLRGKKLDPLKTFKNFLYSNIKYLSSTDDQDRNMLIKVIGEDQRNHLKDDPAIVEPYLQNLIGKLKEHQMKEILEKILPFKMTACTVHRLKGEVCFLPKGENTPMKKLMNASLLKKLRQCYM